MAKAKRALNKEANDKPKVQIDPRRLGFAALIGLGLVFLILALYQGVVLTAHSAEKARIKRAAESQAAAIRETLNRQRAAVAEVATRGTLISALDQSEGLRLNVGAQVASEIGADRVLVVETEIEGKKSAPYPGLDYAALSVGLFAKNTGEVGGPLYTSGDVSGRIHWSAPLGNPISGMVVVTYPGATITTGLKEEASGSYLDLRTISSRGIAQVLVSYGVSSSFTPIQDPTFDVDGEYLVGYGQTTPFGMFVEGWSHVIALALGAVLMICGAIVIRVGRKLLRSTEQGAEAEAGVPAPAIEADEELRAAMDFTREAREAKAQKAPADTEPGAVPDASLFRAYDIRGVVGKTLNADVARSLGRAIGSEAVDRGQNEIVVGRDGRHSGPELQDALMQGLTQSGINVIDIGAAPTGALYFAAYDLGCESGVMVTGSHNPPEYNGFKIMLGGETLSGDAILALRSRLENGTLHSGQGGVQETDILEEYVDRIASDIQVEEPLKVVVDCGNGIAGCIAPRVIEEIGCEVIPLHCDVDGDFPNHHPDPSVPENLADLITTVSQLGADIGVAFDGDGDRLGVVTAGGDIIYADRILMMLAEDVLLRNPGATIIYDVKSSAHLARVILSAGGSPLMWKTGHSLIKQKMKETDAALAGEMSGHFFFAERWYGFDDGIYAASRLLEILASHPDGPVDSLQNLPQSSSTPEIKVPLKEGEPAALVAKFAAKAKFDGARMTTIDGVRADFDDGWGLVRASNTTPCLVLRFEGDSESSMNRIVAEFKKLLLSVKRDLQLPF